MRQIVPKNRVSDHITMEVIDNLIDWKSLKYRWNNWVENSLNPDIFTTFEFLEAAWETHSRNCKLHILLVKYKNQIIGIAPLKIRSRSLYGIPARTIEPISTNIAEDAFFIVLSDTQRFYIAIAEYLLKGLGYWDKINFYHLRDGHPLITSLPKQRLNRFGHIYELKPNLLHPIVNTCNPWKSYYHQLKPKFRQKIRSSTKKMLDAGKVHVLSFKQADEIRHHIAHYVKLENRSWKTEMRSGITRDNELQSMYNKMLTSCAKNGWVEITFLVLNKWVLAGGIAFVYDNEYCYLQTAYDQRAGHYNAGIVLMTLNVWRAHNAGLAAVNFMGNYVDYKRNWSTHEWQSWNMQIRKRFSAEGFAHYAAKTIKKWRRDKQRQNFLRQKKHVQAVECPPVELQIDQLPSDSVALNPQKINEIIFNSEKPIVSRCEKVGRVDPELSIDEIERLVKERNKARRNKDWLRADQIRERLFNQDILVMDTPYGTCWHLKPRKVI